MLGKKYTSVPFCLLLVFLFTQTAHAAQPQNQTTTNSNMITTYLKNIDTDLKRLTAVIEHPTIPSPPPPLPAGAMPCRPDVQNGSSVMVCPFPNPQFNNSTKMPSNLPVFPQLGPCKPIFAHGINQTICAPIPPNSQSQFNSTSPLVNNATALKDFIKKDML